MKPETRMNVAAMAAALGIDFGRGKRLFAKREKPRTWKRPHQGKQEMARRVRQIERGQLTASNGLV